MLYETRVAIAFWALAIPLTLFGATSVASSNLSKMERWERMPISTNIEDRR